MTTRYTLRDVLETNGERITHDPETNYDITLDRYALGVEYDKLKIGQQSDKYFQLVRPSLDKPIGTITATGGNVGAASVTHPLEKRKFTLKELRALSSFPEDFELTGTYEQRWERIGRSVPPLMMKAIAESVKVNILDKCL
jgi:DNA (cytosine-5)-methyltransferase 1